jgi:prepilin signal peptidase PulO-like enzyme (type II secretory pathway)
MTTPLLAALFAAGGFAGAFAVWTAARSGARAIDAPIGDCRLWYGAAGAVLALYAGALGAWSPGAGAGAASLVAAFACAITDAKSGYVFDRALLVGLIAVLALGAGTIVARIVAAAAIGALYALPYLASRGRGFGLGDVKLGVLLGAGIGLAGGLSAFLASFVLGAAFGLVALALRRLDRKSRLPFAPFMAVGAALGLAFPLPFAFAA